MNEANVRRTTAKVIRLVMACIVCASSQSIAAQEYFSGTTMGPVPYNVTVPQLPAGKTVQEIDSLIKAELEDVNQRMSTYISDSEVSQFNQSRSTDWIEVSPATLLVVARALELSNATDGAFDITVAPLVSLWSFGPEAKVEELPDESEIESARSMIGYQHLEVQDSPPALRKAVPDLSIDLSAIAKGYAVDQVSRALLDLGVTAFMVEVGGEVRTHGQSPRQQAWVIGIESPVPGRRGIEHRVELDQRSLATSGDYRNFFVVDGKRYSHTIDPRTGRPVEHNLTSISIIADDCMTADAIATAMMVLGPEEIQRTASDLGVDALWMTHDGDIESGKVVTTTTAEFPVLALPPNEGAANLWPMFAAGFVVFVVALLGMSVGVIFSNRRIKGSCGGLAALKGGDGTSPCEICESRSNCDEFKKALAKQHAPCD